MVLPESCLYQYHMPLLIVGYYPGRELQKHYSRPLRPAILHAMAVDDIHVSLVKLVPRLVMHLARLEEIFGRETPMFFWAQNSTLVLSPVILAKSDSAGEVNLW